MKPRLKVREAGAAEAMEEAQGALEHRLTTQLEGWMHLLGRVRFDHQRALDFFEDAFHVCPEGWAPFLQGLGITRHTQVKMIENECKTAGTADKFKRAISHIEKQSENVLWEKILKSLLACKKWNIIKDLLKETILDEVLVLKNQKQPVEDGVAEINEASLLSSDSMLERTESISSVASTFSKEELQKNMSLNKEIDHMLMDKEICNSTTATSVRRSLLDFELSNTRNFSVFDSCSDVVPGFWCTSDNHHIENNQQLPTFSESGHLNFGNSVQPTFRVESLCEKNEFMARESLQKNGYRKHGPINSSNAEERNVINKQLTSASNLRVITDDRNENVCIVLLINAPEDELVAGKVRRYLKRDVIGNEITESLIIVTLSKLEETFRHVRASHRLRVALKNADFIVPIISKRYIEIIEEYDTTDDNVDIKFIHEEYNDEYFWKGSVNYRAIPLKLANVKKFDLRQLVGWLQEPFDLDSQHKKFKSHVLRRCKENIEKRRANHGVPGRN